MHRFALTAQTALVLEQGDLTQLRVDAIANAANRGLRGGGGVDGAIHRAAGPELRAACERIAEVSEGVRCPTGEARITPGFALPAPWIIHTVGPVYRGPESAELLASCYCSSLGLASEHGLRSIGFPAISCGVYGYPLLDAAAIALGTCRQHAGSLGEVWFVLFEGQAWGAWLQTAQQMFPSA